MTPQFYYVCHVSIKVAGHSLGQHCSHQFVGLLSLHLQLLCPLSNQILQVGWVLLQHAQHRVNDVCFLSLGDALELSHERDRTEMTSPACNFNIKGDEDLHKSLFFSIFYLFEDLLKGLPPVWLLTPGLFHNLYHIQRCLVHWQSRSTQRRRLFDLADNLCQYTQTHTDKKTQTLGTHRNAQKQTTNVVLKIQHNCFECDFVQFCQITMDVVGI